MILNQNLNWNRHLDKISINISRSIGAMYRLKNNIPIHISSILYNSTILPHLSYCILAWDAKTEHIFKLQKRAVRIISNSRFISNTEPIFKSFNFLKVRDLYKIHILKFIVIMIWLVILDLLSCQDIPNSQLKYACPTTPGHCARGFE